MTEAHAVRRLEASSWRARQAEHADQVDRLIGPYLRARRRGEKHPVLDFLFVYYASRPAHVRRWHPGFGTVLADDGSRAGAAYLSLRGYERRAEGITVGAEYLRRRRGALAETDALLSATAERPARMGCFGLHEWAMVYRSDQPRHDHPLRLGASGTDAVVESMPLRCTHFDAFRFFTAGARPLNEEELTPPSRLTRDQPGCLHTVMDLYRACFTLAPLMDSDLTLRAFTLAHDARDLDMRASPYDLSNLGYPPVPVETAAGRAQYTREQSVIAERGQVIRAEIIDRCRQLLAIDAESAASTGG